MTPDLFPKTFRKSPTYFRLHIALLFAIVSGSGEDLHLPSTIASTNGALSVTVQLTSTTVSTDDYELTTRLYNASLPGPTLLLAPGDNVTLTFVNTLPNQGAPYIHNRFSAPDDSNLHFHGLFISGELPSDDSTLVVGPAQNYTYHIDIPSDHLPGTHWLHPHRHGSTALQVSGGAAAAVIVRDPPGFLPQHISDAFDVVLVVQPMDIDATQRIADRSGDGLFKGSTAANGNRLILVNGQVQPVLRVSPNKWVRLRIIHAGWQRDNLRISIGSGCEISLLAKDGVYISDFPRSISEADVTLGGRADLMLRCNAGTHQMINRRNSLMSIVAEGDLANSADLKSWSPKYPSYLSDLDALSVTQGCSCSTAFGGNAVNGIRFDENVTLHASALGTVLERRIDADGHPYHQHVYPFQLTQDIGNSGYSRQGDWHDSTDATTTVRYRPSRYAGKVMIHCLRLEHEDQGMMAIEQVRSDGGAAACTCTAPQSTPIWVIPVSVSMALIVVFLAVYLIVARKKRMWPFNKDGIEG